MRLHRIWARRLLLFRLFLMAVIAVLLTVIAFILPSGIGSFARQEDMFAVTATFGTILVIAALFLGWMIYGAARQDWNNVFVPTSYFVLPLPSHEDCKRKAGEISALCATRRIPCQVVEKYQSDTRSHGLRLGFIDDEDMMLVRLLV